MILVLYERGLSLVLGWDILELFPGYNIYCCVYLRICIHNRCYLKLNNYDASGVMQCLLCYGCEVLLECYWSCAVIIHERKSAIEFCFEFYVSVVG